MVSAARIFLLVFCLAIPILAQASGQAPQTDFMRSVLPMMLVMFAVIYFLMIRPEQKKQKDKQKMVEALKKGDRVLTIGGLCGTVGSIKGNSVMVKTGDTTVEVAKSAVSTVMNKDGSEKSPEQDSRGRNGK